jgi:glucosamine--fructose-6-phosphate aminotransferase (isomerizing)
VYVTENLTFGGQVPVAFLCIRHISSYQIFIRTTMCGIIAYLGEREAFPLLIKGLQRLEYRGYDSAGVAVIENGSLAVSKKKGKVSNLEKNTQRVPSNATLGIAHTRWATHGEPSDANAHPHVSQDRKIALVHNGIIENYATLRQRLQSRGHVFTSETDSEVLVHIIEDIRNETQLPLEEAVRLALTEIVGAYAIVVISSDDPDRLVAARKGSPLVIGIGQNELFFASDAAPIIEYTKDIVYLNDLEIAIASRTGFRIINPDNSEKSPYIQRVEIELEAIEKGGFPHFMLKEIFEQPRSIADSMRGRVNHTTGHIQLGGLASQFEKLSSAKRIIIVGCGTSWHAGLVAEYLFEELARVNVEVEYASEFRYRNPIISSEDVVIAISQSGETADTLAAIELAKDRGATLIGVCNSVGSSIARATHAGAYTHAGPEIGVASTKAFTTQVIVLMLIAIAIGKSKGTIRKETYHSLLNGLHLLPQRVEQVFQNAEKIREIAYIFTYARNFIYLGRGLHFPVALEGALKLKRGH